MNLFLEIIVGNFQLWSHFVDISYFSHRKVAQCIKCFILVCKLPWQRCTCHCSPWGEELVEVCTVWGEKPVHQQCKTNLWTRGRVFWWWVHRWRAADRLCKVWRGTARGQHCQLWNILYPFVQNRMHDAPVVWSGTCIPDHSYCLSDILQFCVSLDVNTSNMHAFCDYEIERLLRTMQNTFFRLWWLTMLAV